MGGKFLGTRLWRCLTPALDPPPCQTRPTGACTPTLWNTLIGGILLRNHACSLGIICVVPPAEQRHIRRLDYTIVAYMDDLLFVSCVSPQRTQQLITLLPSIFRAFGIAVSADKGVLEPVTSCEFLEFVVHVDGTLALTHKRCAKLHCLAHRVQTAVKCNRRFVSFQ